MFGLGTNRLLFTAASSVCVPNGQTNYLLLFMMFNAAKKKTDL